jgi:hypothetical protein
VTLHNLTLHRLCTLARKQGAAFVTVECALHRADVTEEIDAVDLYHGGGGTAEAVSMAFFAGSELPEAIDAVDESALLGVVVLINYQRHGFADWTPSYIHEAIFVAPFKTETVSQKRLPLLNNYIAREAEFTRQIHGRDFTIRGIYYCQQNGQTHVCAHACLRMALNSLGSTNGLVTSRAINSELNVSAPQQGLTLGQLKQMITSVTGTEPMIADCTALSKQNYFSVLASLVESGCMVLLVFTTGNGTEHVVTVFGHTRNSDEWHPQAIPGYSGPQTDPFYTSSSWIDHFIIHDDNFGPHYTLSSRALEVDPTISAHWIIAIHPHLAQTSPHYAESLGAMILRSTLPSLLARGTGRWLDYVTTTPSAYVMRAILLSRNTYQAHLLSAVAHDGSSLTPNEIALTDCLPDWFWMVEFSLPALFTGNRSKLGEIFVSTGMTPNTPPIQLGSELINF